MKRQIHLDFIAIGQGFHWVEARDDTSSFVSLLGSRDSQRVPIHEWLWKPHIQECQ